MLARRAGLRVGILSGRVVRRPSRAARAELGIEIVRQGVADKAAALREILAAEGIAAAARWPTWATT